MKHTGYFFLVILMGLVLAACQPAASPTPKSQDPSPTGTELLPYEPAPAGVEQEFSTDFSIHSIHFDEILSGGPPKDGIPAIETPKFVSIQEADEWLKPIEPVIQVVIGQEAKAYPIQVLIWHEIANDMVGGVPVIVTFCPLCNTAIVFERTVNGQVLDFGTTGRLRYSNLIMYDRQTETWWQQAEGKGIIGELTGIELEFVPAAIISWEEFKNAHPEGIVLSRDTGFTRRYGQNPYIGYDNVNNPPFLYKGPPTPGSLAPVARVLALDLNGDVIAYPYDVIETAHVVNDRVGDQDIVVFWSPGTASALDTATIAEGKDVGTAAIYDRLLDGKRLSFKYEGQLIIDEQTGSTWDVLGRSISGPNSGTQLTPIVAVNHFWFSWAAFKPETRIYQP